MRWRLRFVKLSGWKSPMRGRWEPVPSLLPVSKGGNAACVILAPAAEHYTLRFASRCVGRTDSEAMAATNAEATMTMPKCVHCSTGRGCEQGTQLHAEISSIHRMQENPRVIHSRPLSGGGQLLMYHQKCPHLLHSAQDPWICCLCHQALWTLWTPPGLAKLHVLESPGHRAQCASQEK
jgi:hypothetical protein